MYNHVGVKGERIISVLELKNRLHELQWLNDDVHSKQYSIALYVYRLDNYTALRPQQLRALVESALYFSSSKLNDTMDDRDDDDLDRNRSNDGSPGTDWSEDVTAYVLLLMMKSSPVYTDLIYTSSNVELVASSSSSAAAAAANSSAAAAVISSNHVLVEKPISVSDNDAYIRLRSEQSHIVNIVDDGRIEKSGTGDEEGRSANRVATMTFPDALFTTPVFDGDSKTSPLSRSSPSSYTLSRVVTITPLEASLIDYRDIHGQEHRQVVINAEEEYSPSSSKGLKVRRTEYRGNFRLVGKQENSLRSLSLPPAAAADRSHDRWLPVDTHALSHSSSSPPSSSSSSSYMSQQTLDLRRVETLHSLSPLMKPSPPPRRKKVNIGDEGDDVSKNDRVSKNASRHVNGGDDDYDEEDINININKSHKPIVASMSEKSAMVRDKAHEIHSTIKLDISASSMDVLMMDNSTIPIIDSSSSSSSIPSISLRQNNTYLPIETTYITSPMRKIETSWKPIKYSAYNSIAWDKMSRRLLKVDCMMGSSDKNSLFYGRDNTGSLVIIQRATSNLLKEVLRKKLFALVVFRWLTTGNTVDLLKKINMKKKIEDEEKDKRDKLVGMSRQVSFEDEIHEVNSAVLESKDTDLRASDERLTAKIDKNSGAKAMLSALFTKKVISNDNISTTIPSSASTMTESQTNGPHWATIIPSPPPIPDSWPPIPYTSSSDGATNGNGITIDGMSSQNTGPKLKQIYLTNIIVSEVEGTVWQDMHGMSDFLEVFDDIEDQFTTDKKKMMKYLKPQVIGVAAKASSKAVKREEV